MPAAHLFGAGLAAAVAATRTTRGVPTDAVAGSVDIWSSITPVSGHAGEVRVIVRTGGTASRSMSRTKPRSTTFTPRSGSITLPQRVQHLGRRDRHRGASPRSFPRQSCVPDRATRGRCISERRAPGSAPGSLTPTTPKAAPRRARGRSVGRGPGGGRSCARLEASRPASPSGAPVDRAPISDTPTAPSAPARSPVCAPRRCPRRCGPTRGCSRAAAASTPTRYRCRPGSSGTPGRSRSPPGRC